MAEGTKDLTDAEFEANQKKLRDEQGIKDPNAVPEQRPIASQQPSSDLDSDLTKQQREDGKFDPMPKEAYEKAEKEPTKASLKKERIPSVLVGQRVRIIDGEFKGNAGAVIEVRYDGPEEAAKAGSGDPEAKRFAKVASIMVRTRGGSHALVPLTPDQVENIDVLGIHASVE